MYLEGYALAMVFMISFSILVIVISTVLPVYGYFRRRWKGVAIGCLMQPVVCAVVIGLVAGGIIIYKQISIKMDMKSAMVTVKSIEQGVNGTDTLTWYLKADEECLMDAEKNSDRFDVIRLDSLKTAVSVEDRIVVRFDIKNQKVTATDYDQPAEVIDVKWDKVSAYFGK